MPELPEVETIRRGLEPVLAGRRIGRAETRSPALRWPLPPQFAARLGGRRVGALGRRGKYLLVELDRGETLLIHFGMSGRMLVAEGNAEIAAIGRGTHHHIVLDLAEESGRPVARLVFCDPRRFGIMDLFPTSARDEHRLLGGLGPEPLGNEFGPDWLAARLAGRRAPVKNLLLDQRVIAGVGNIYASEALHRAGIAPVRAGGRIARHRVGQLAAAIRNVLAEAIEAGGSTLRDYRRADGELGYFQHHFAVYGRAGAPCRNPGCRGLVRSRVLGGRSTYWCPACQR